MALPKDSLDGSVRLFAHRGGKAHAPENTLEAFGLALRLGATALESDAWLSQDGKAVLHHDPKVGHALRKLTIASTPYSELPAHLPTLDHLYELIANTPTGVPTPASVDISLDLKDPAVFDAVVTAARRANAESRLWLCSPSLESLTGWREHTTAKLIHSMSLTKIDHGAERHAAILADRGIDGFNMSYGEWDAGKVAIMHRFELYALGWDAQHERQIATLINMGIDGIFGDHVDRLVAVAELYQS